MHLPLEKIRVLDLTRFAAGPICTMFLADMGAEVIRIEPPEGSPDRYWALLGPDGETLSFKSWGRNKKGITLRLNTEKGKALFRELVRLSDVIVHNFVHGTWLANELTYEKITQINSRIIVASLTGYGQYGPYATKGCFDTNAQARAGSMMLNGLPGGPPLNTTVPYVDYSTGLTTALGLLLALFHRERTGVAQSVDVALFDVACAIDQSMASLMLYQVYGEVREHLGNGGFSTYMYCANAKDGMVMISPATNSVWERFVTAMDREDLKGHPRFKNDQERWRHSEVIDSIVDDWVRKKTVDEIQNILDEAGVPCAPVNTSYHQLSDHQVKAREMVILRDHPGVGNLPLQGITTKFSVTQGRIKTLAPRLGEHNEEIYTSLLGLSSEDFSRLKQEGVI